MTDITVSGTSGTQSTNQQTPEDKATADARAKRQAELAALNKELDAYDQYFRTPSETLQLALGESSLLSMRSLLGRGPLLIPPGCSAEQAIAVLRPMSVEVRNVSIRTASANLKAQSERKERAQQDAQLRVQDWMTAFAESIKNNKASDALKWITRVLVPTMAVLAVPLAVAAGPALLALTALMSAYSLAQFASEEAGGPSLSISDLLTDAISKGLQQAGLSEQDAKHYAMAIGGAVVVVAAVAMRQSGGVSGLSGMANNAKTGLQIANVAARAAAPLIVALDPKFIGNMAGGLTYAAIQADAAVNGKDMTDEDKRKAAETAAIANVVFATASQLFMGFTLMRQGAQLKQAADAGNQALKMSANAARLQKIGTTTQSVLSVGNGTNSTGRGGLEVDTAQKQYIADMASAEADKAELAVDHIETDPALARLKLAMERSDKVDEGLDEACKRNELSKKIPPNYS